MISSATSLVLCARGELPPSAVSFACRYDYGINKKFGYRILHCYQKVILADDLSVDELHRIFLAGELDTKILNNKVLRLDPIAEEVRNAGGIKIAGAMDDKEYLETMMGNFGY